MREAPDIGNYFSGKGRVYFKVDGDQNFRDVGEVSALEFEAATEKLEHFAHRFGTRLKDFSKVNEKTGTITMTMDEWTPRNLALGMLGTVSELSDGREVIEMLGAAEIQGELRLVGTNDIGPRFEATWFRVNFVPGSSIGFIGDDLQTFELNGEVLARDGRFGTLEDITDLEPEIESASA
jgi:hypothetical protein